MSENHSLVPQLESYANLRLQNEMIPGSVEIAFRHFAAAVKGAIAAAPEEPNRWEPQVQESLEAYEQELAEHNLGTPARPYSPV
jgi:hypothetical protein